LNPSIALHIFAVFGGVREAARVVLPWRLLEGGGEGRGGQRRSCGFGDCESCGRGDGGVDIVLDDFIGLVVEDRSEALRSGMICSMLKLPE
jgi:hypothetical protein